MTIDISWCIDVVSRHTCDEHKSQVHLNGKGATFSGAHQSWLLCLNDMSICNQNIFEQSNESWVHLWGKDATSAAGLINLLLLQQYNQPSFLTGVEIILSQVICFLGYGGNIPNSLCIQNVQGISLRKSKWTEGHWWRLDCNALRQSWSIRRQLFIFAICQQWLWSMSWQ